MVNTVTCVVEEAEVEEEEEQTSHYVQLEDGTYAEMVEGHQIIKPGHQMLVIHLRIIFWDTQLIKKKFCSSVVDSKIFEFGSGSWILAQILKAVLEGKIPYNVFLTK